jgi:hypothetical protein
MPTLTHLAIDEFSHPVQALALGPATTLAFTTGASATMPSRLAAGVQVVRLVADQDCYIAIGALATVSAPVGGALLSAGIPEYFRVPMNGPSGAAIDTVGDGLAVAVRGKTAAGNLSITEMF